MVTANQILRNVPDAELKQAAAEALEWSKSGVLSGDVLRGIARRLQSEAGLAEDGMLRDTDTLVCREAARRFASLDDPLSLVATWLAFTAPEVHAAFLREFKR